MDDLDRKIIKATQSGLPLVPEPYRAVAESIGCSAETVMQRMQAMLDQGMIRRIAAVPNHYALGFKNNGMSVWNLPDHRVAHWGPIIGQMDFVSHAYQRPRYLPEWPYNFFAMVHGRSRQEVMDKVDKIAQTIGEDDQGHEVLFSYRILKKTGLRLKD